MKYSEFRKIDIISFLSGNGFNVKYRQVSEGKILKHCPICRSKDHFIIFDHDNNMFSYNGCFSGDIIDLNSALFGLSKRDSINQLKAKYFNYIDISNTQNKRAMTINLDNLTDIESKILNYYDKEICKFIIEISQGYTHKSQKLKDIIDKIVYKLITKGNTLEKYEYIQYLKMMKSQKRN